MNRKNKGKIFALHPTQKDLINKYCFESCGRIIIGSLYDKEFGAMYPCREEHCEYEGGRAYTGESAEGKVWIRKLK